MRRGACAGVALAALLVASAPPLPAAQTDLRLLRDRIWFTPAPGSLDLQRMFEAPQEWRRALDTIQVFKFYQQHTEGASPSVGPNRYDALARAGAFARLTRDWGKRIALEAGAVKEFYCTADESGMREAVRNTQAAIDNVAAAGGLVSYLAMDEPFIGGLSPWCGRPVMERTADRLHTYMTALREKNPRLRIGLIEAYPTFTPAEFRQMLDLMKARGTPAAFLHVDVDLNALRPGRDAIGRDLIAIADAAAAHRIPYGVIIWGHDGNADALYAADARRLANAIHRTFRTWSVMPEHLIFQSWAESSTGLKITPSNLPESRPDTHTFLLNDIYRQLRYTVFPRQ
ncbi:MAG TPA: hypothetical protein VM364_04555 [Vicinamibacterales bacterium]|nr:hypothetical protein [Vicinamibacterales bacterium]